MKKMIGISALILAVFSLLFLSGCDVSYTQEELDSKIAEIGAVKDTEYQGQLNALNEQLDTLQSNVDNLNIAITEKDDKIEDLAGQLEVKEVVKEVELAGEEIVVGLGGNLKATIKDNDLEKLFDGEIDFDGDDFDAEEVIKFTNAFEILTSARDDAEFSSEAYLGATAKEAISYKLILNDVIDRSLFDEDEKLEIPFLGTTITIVDVDSVLQEITILLGDETYLNAGESITIDGKVVTLIKTGTNGAVISVDEIEAMINIDETKKINGIQVNLKNIFNDDGVEFDSASLIIGEDIQMTVASGDDFELFEECDDCFWVWDIRFGNNNQYVGILSNEIMDDLDRDFPPIKVGESIMLPNDYVEINFKEVTDVDYMDIELSFDTVYEDDELVGNLEAVILKASNSDGFLIGNEESDEIYIGFDGGIVIYYLDEDNKIIDGTGKAVKVINDDFDLDLIASFVGYTKISIGDIDIFARPNSAQLGNVGEEAEPADVFYINTIGTRDYDVLCDNGVIIEDVENNADNDEVMLRIPSEVVEATIIVK